MEAEKDKKRNVNPRQNANLFSKITFWYTGTIFTKGFRKELEEEDLYEVLPEYDTHSLGDRIELEWNLLKDKTRFPMYLVFWNMFGKYYILLGLSRFISIILNVVCPILVGNLVFYFTPGQTVTTKFDAYLYAFLLIGLQISDSVYRQNYFFLVECLTIKIRTAVCSLIYRKILKLPASHLRDCSFGKITNLITRDINAFNNFFYNFNEAWIGLISVAIICYNMYRKIGLAFLVVLVALIVFIPLQAAARSIFIIFVYIIAVLTNVWVASLKTKTSEKTDARIGAFQETLSSIRNLKMYVWEKFLKQKINIARKQEMNILFKMIAAHFLLVATAIIIHNISFYLVFMTYIWLGHRMTAETMYFVAGSFLTIGAIINTKIPYGTFFFSQVLIAIKRMQMTVQKLEIHLEETKNVANIGKPIIQISNVTISANNKVILENINVNIDKGLTLVTGHAGSGKSTLLMAILNEFKASKDNLKTEGTISYASQEPWLFPSTIRQNIIFGNKYEVKRYRDVLKACALQYDFDRLENGDLTIVADRGINLSKGQQSRINLARAVYRVADIYLLDDCLSSLDPLVARHIFVNCIMRFLNNKIIILVTHNPHLMAYANNTLTVEDNGIKLLKNKPAKLNETISEEILSESNNIYLSNSEIQKNEQNVESRLLDSRTPKYRIYGEDKKTGSVSFQMYKIYIKLGGGIKFLLIIFIIFTLTQLVLSYNNKLIGIWANLEGEISQSNNTHFNVTHNSASTEKRNVILYNYTLSIIGISIATLIRACILFLFARNVSLNLHKKMLNSVLGAPLQFFDRTFIGNVVNRFSKDLVTVDENIPLQLHHLTAIIFETVGNLILISSTNLRFLVPSGVLVVTSLMLRYFFLKIGQPLNRLDASTKSPVIGYLNSTMEGLPIIKAFSAQKILQEEFEKRHNIYNSAYFSYFSCTKAFIFIIDVLMSFFLAVVVLQFVIFEQGVKPGDVGLAISQSLIMAAVVPFAFYQCAEIETQMTSVERAIEYTDIKSETRAGTQLKNWPTKGEIRYENVHLSINNSYPLKNINIFIKSKEKIGIVGRTGAGKSSIISALFRLYEIEGKIEIDGIDIEAISLDFFRTRISVIPQDAMLLNASLRDNIDPEKLHQDQEIWNALETVQLKHFVSSLDVNVKDVEFSCSQRQLICLARVLLKNNKIVVLDEMIETVDEEIENLINGIVDRCFAACTVIKIAHKLRFVMACDKILVLKDGQIVEYDSPNILLENKSSLFFKMSKVGFGAAT